MEKVIIPRPTYIVIDDVGWWQGTDGSAWGEPYRTGLKRRHCVADYAALDQLARKLDIRPQVAFVAGEWDRRNLLRQVPNSNWQLSAWDNSKNMGKHLDEAMEVINAGNLCLAIHGLCHEYWDEPGQPSRCEFGYERDLAIIRQHLDAYFTILEDNGYKGRIQAYVPPGFRHKVGWETGLMKQYGARYMSTTFTNMQTEQPADRCIVEEGVINCDRVVNPIKWYEVNAMPPQEINKGFFGLHWPNLLHINPAENNVTIQRWVDHFNRYRQIFGIILAQDEDEGHQQAYYEKYAHLSVAPEGVRISFDSQDCVTDRDLILQSTRRLKAREVRKTDSFYEYQIDPVAETFIRWLDQTDGG